MLRILRTIAAVLSFVVAVGAGKLVQAIECGDVLSPGSFVVLTRDVGPCVCTPDGQPSLTIVGPVTVNLNGFAIACEQCEPANEANPSVGVLIEGDDAVVYDGTVEGCNQGVVVSGGGAHTLGKLRAEDNIDSGIAGLGTAFIVESNDNLIALNKAIGNSGDGFHISGSGNVVYLNLAEGNELAGFLLTSASSNTIANNIATENTMEGVRLNSSSNNTLFFNTSTSNREQAGFVVDAVSNGNLLNDNLARANGLDNVSTRKSGFDVQGSGNNVVHNIAIGHPGHGFDVSGPRNEIERAVATENGGNGVLLRVPEGETTVEQNSILTATVLKNGESGIYVESGVTNTVISNSIALENTEYDLRDDNSPPCSDNQWEVNLFGTANQDCIE